MEISEFEQTSFSRAICQQCGMKFIFPYNGDMNYGIFYFNGERGTSLGFYESLNHPVWLYVKKVINENTAEGREPKTDFNMGARMQWIISRCADAIDNQRLTSEVVCPQCSSTHITLKYDEIVEQRKIPHVSFHQFEDLSEGEKVNRILNLYSESKSKFPRLHDNRSIWSKQFDYLCELLFRPIRWVATFMRKS